MQSTVGFPWWQILKKRVSAPYGPLNYITVLTFFYTLIQQGPTFLHQYYKF